MTDILGESIRFMDKKTDRNKDKQTQRRMDIKIRRIDVGTYAQED